MRKRYKVARWAAIVLAATIGSAVLGDFMTGTWNAICKTKPETAFCSGR